MNYTYNKKSIDILREEKEGNTIIVASESGIQLVLNKTGTEVLKILPECESVEQLLDKLHDKYTELDKRILEKDIQQILHLFEIYDIIKLEQEAALKRDFRVSIAGDIDYKKVSQFIKECLNTECIKYSNLQDEGYFSALNLRLRTMQNKEFGAFVEKFGQIKGFFSFSGDGFLNSNVLIITNIFFDKEVENIKETLMMLIDHVIRKCIAQKNIRKIRIPIIMKDKERAFVEKLMEIGFVEECILKDEVRDGDIVFCTYWL